MNVRMELLKNGFAVDNPKVCELKLIMYWWSKHICQNKHNSHKLCIGDLNISVRTNITPTNYVLVI
jgi:hypothetical protein